MRPSFFHHLHPPTIPARQARLRYTLAAGGLAVFLVLMLAVTGILLRFLSYQSQPPAPTEFVLEAPANYMVGSHTLLPDVPVLLVHSTTGFTAISLVCPHLGCMVEQQPDGFTCPCHGSRFDQRGQVTHGPASKALTILHLETAADGKLHLFTK